jgi:hypothetical protein
LASPPTIDDEFAKQFLKKHPNLAWEETYNSYAEAYVSTDKINVIIEGPEEVILSVKNNFDYIRSEILANSLEIVNQINSEEAVSVEVDDNLSIKTIVNKYSNGE